MNGVGVDVIIKVSSECYSAADTITLQLLNLFIEFSFLVGKPFLPNHCADTL